MSLSEALLEFQNLVPEFQVGRLQEELPREFITAALRSTGAASVRKRKLPAEQVLFAVVGMALFRNMSIPAVVHHLGLALPGKDGEVSLAPSAISEARERLGPEPLAWLLRACAERWWAESQELGFGRWRSFNLLGMDGTEFRVPDSPENRAHFRGHNNGRADSGYPLCRAVVLFGLASHTVLDAEFGPHTKSEIAVSKALWAKVPDNSLVVVDRLYRASTLLVPLEKRNNVHFLCRAPEKRNWEVVEKLGPGDDIVEVKLSHDVRRDNPELPERWRFRVIEYQRKGFRPSAVCTSLLDPEMHPAKELAELYHQRWEIELAYDELKTEMLQREETLRSQTPRGIEQELWGLLLAFNLVRSEMTRIAAEADVSPTRISFIAAYQTMQVLWLTLPLIAPGRVPEVLRRMRADVRRFILPPRRSERSYPREVKLQPRKYAKKRPLN